MKDDLPDPAASIALLKKQRLALGGVGSSAPKSGEALLLWSPNYRPSHPDWSLYGDNVVNLERQNPDQPDPPEAA